MEKYELIVIGGGPGGSSAAKTASKLGAKVLIIEKNRVGGVCLNCGCIPTKAILSSAGVFKKISSADSYGLNVTSASFDYAKIIERKNRIVEKLVGGMESGYKKASFDFLKGEAKFAGNDEIVVSKEDGTEERFSADKVIIATGSSSREIPPLKFDGKNVIDSKAALDMKELPESILIVGGGPIGCEFATIMNTFGVDVHLVELSSRLLPLEDEELGKRLGLAFKKSGIKLYLNDKVESIEYNNGISVKLSSGADIGVSLVLSAVGRARNIYDIGLENTSVAVENNAVKVDDFYRTSAENIYAIGDVIATPQLAHVAMYEGRIAGENAVLGNKKKRGTYIFPSAVFSHPEVASVGMTKKAAEEAGIDAGVVKELFSANGKAYCIGEPEGFVKIVYDKGNKAILGVQAMGPMASEIISEGLILVKNKVLIDELSFTIHQHPTLMEAFQDAALNFSC